jgi:hypothetical protein
LAAGAGLLALGAVSFAGVSLTVSFAAVGFAAVLRDGVLLVFSFVDAISFPHLWGAQRCRVASILPRSSENQNWFLSHFYISAQYPAPLRHLILHRAASYGDEE